MTKVKKQKQTRGIHKKMSFTELMEQEPEVVELLFQKGMHCACCPIASEETLEQGASAHGLDADKLLKEFNEKIKKKMKKKKIKKLIKK